jgi:hypothetical protein
MGMGGMTMGMGMAMGMGMGMGGYVLDPRMALGAQSRPPSLPKMKRPMMMYQPGMPYMVYGGGGGGGSMPGSPRRSSPPSRPGSADQLGMGDALLIGGAGGGGAAVSGGGGGGGGGGRGVNGVNGYAATFVGNGGSSGPGPGEAYLSIPMPPGAGPSAGPLSDAEVQAIQMIVTSSEGVKLAYAVQGIMQHVLTHYGRKVLGDGGADGRQSMGGAQPAHSAETDPSGSHGGQAPMGQQPAVSE